LNASPSSTNGSNPAAKIYVGGKFDKLEVNKGEALQSTFSSEVLR